MSLLSIQYKLIHNGVERLAIIALNTQKVPCPILLILFTIVACYVDHTTKFLGDGLQRHTRRHGIPGGKHTFPGFRGFFANGATAIMRSQLLEARPMNSMTTRHLMRC